jgi:hypothetical protein
MSKAEELRDLILGDFNPQSYKDWITENEATLMRALRSDEIIQENCANALDWMRGDLVLLDNTKIVAVLATLRRFVQ